MPAVAAFLVGPVAVAFIARLVTSRGSWSPDLLLLLVALIALFVAVRFATRSQKPKDAEAPYQRLSEVENENWQLAIAVALVVTGAVVLALTVLPHGASVRLGWLGEVAETVALVALLPTLVIATGVLSSITA
jgi:Ca2+/Na+ antiporter